MSGLSTERPTSNDPGGLRARADGQRVEVRTHEGALIRIVDSSVADDLVRAGLADNLKHGLRLRPGIPRSPSRLDQPTGPPDLDRLRGEEPERYVAFWRGKRVVRSGKGALLRSTVDRTVFKPSRLSGSSGSEENKVGYGQREIAGDEPKANE